MWYISMYHVSNICLIRHDLKIYDIHTLSICINSFNCLHKWKLEMWKNPSRLKLSNSSYTSRALTSNDTKETQHKFHKEKKIPTLTIMIKQIKIDSQKDHCHGIEISLNKSQH